MRKSCVLTASAGLGGLIDDALGVASNAVDTAANVTTGAIDTARERTHRHYQPGDRQVVLEHRYYPDGEEVISKEEVHHKGPDSITVEKTVTTETYLD